MKSKPESRAPGGPPAEPDLVARADESRAGGEHRRHWIKENRQAFADYDAFVEKHGIYSAGRRLF
ncbi:type II toxin-antitoxin system CcdA family antitoxin [Azospirillum sp. SYSU D00513]|uniref:type II toxin-antitoxin system CcdA family antitoxin n=1 Tax=Azospirillum sp. SYSU D00513 TaxID=2812561 RepID=UPI001A96DC9B|nr:type II toxin-antitoxin system CcdA family antitoxin [Azospirillum sp. SYSU D00513]